MGLGSSQVDPELQSWNKEFDLCQSPSACRASSSTKSRVKGDRLTTVTHRKLIEGRAYLSKFRSLQSNLPWHDFERGGWRFKDALALAATRDRAEINFIRRSTARDRWHTGHSSRSLYIQIFQRSCLFVSFRLPLLPTIQ